VTLFLPIGEKAPKSEGIRVGAIRAFTALYSHALNPINAIQEKTISQMKTLSALFIVCGVLAAQQAVEPNENAARMTAGAAPIYRVSVTARTTQAVNYQHRSGATKIDFDGTDLLPGANGEAKVESKQGRIQIEADFSGLQPATQFGAEYLTYVLWAITPEGRPSNLGEVLLNGSKSKLEVTTDLQVFGLIVTAEPYFAVTQPSDLIVMENIVRPDTKGKIEAINAKYELLQRGQYQRLANPLELKADRKTPLELYEARNAVQIARAEGADRFAVETFQKAQSSLAQAEAYEARNAGRKPVAMTAREAVQTAEDARVIAVKRQEADAVAADRQQLLDREARAEQGRLTAQADADQATKEAENTRIKALAESERLTSEKNAQAATNALEVDRLKRENDNRIAAAAVEAERVKADSDARLAAAGAEADRLKRDNDAQQLNQQAQMDAAAKQKLQLETEKAELRIQLLKQFNAILQTRDTARGLIVNMSDVLFDTGKYSLRPLAREKLAKVAGIVSGHPSLKLDVEGYTDNVGGDDYNQRLSEQRGGAVRDYLTAQGMPSSSVTSRGFGKTQPVASNETASGRQQNRRVELVISGDVIGDVIGTPIAAR
jgi:outer membrane protein OmpA-like peptidoglycan-associated protein